MTDKQLDYLLQFSYKEKSNKHPLRQSKQKSLEASPTHKPPAGASRPTAGSGNRQTAVKATGHKGTAASKDAVSKVYSRLSICLASFLFKNLKI